MNATVVENAPPFKGESILTAIRRRARMRRYRAKKREQIAAQNAHYYRANRQRILESKRNDYVEHREERKAARRARYKVKSIRLFEQRRERRRLLNAPIAIGSREYYTLRRRGQLRWAA